MLVTTDLPHRGSLVSVRITRLTWRKGCKCHLQLPTHATRGSSGSDIGSYSNGLEPGVASRLSSMDISNDGVRVRGL